MVASKVVRLALLLYAVVVLGGCSLTTTVRMGLGGPGADTPERVDKNQRRQ
jgi:hypothetical protein